MSDERCALVLEGGAMRGMYTAGVLDCFMDHDISFDAVIGVSAGALFGVNLLSKQRGRVIRYNKRFNSDKNYMGIRPLLREKNIVSTKYAYDTVPRELDPFDDEELVEAGISWKEYVENTSDWGTYYTKINGEYVQIKSVFDQMDVLRASGSMPVVSKPVKLGNEWYLDGAVTDSIPYEHMLDMGYDRVVVVLTKPADYIKKPMPRVFTSVYKKRFPRFYEAFSNRHIMYNYQLEHLKELEKQGIAEVLRPSEHIKISKVEKDPNKLESLYQLGLRDAERLLADKQGT